MVLNLWSKEYERLAAQLDGASKPLAQKVQKFGPSATKIPLVEAAEKHAEMLDALARNLSRYVCECVCVCVYVCVCACFLLLIYVSHLLTV